jgi:two-component system CheB/CheR fusion protein
MNTNGSASPSHTPSVLVLEDHRDTLRYLSRLLQLQGFTVHEAATCAAARELLAREACHVLVSDVSLPDCSALELMRELRGAGSAVRGIAVSGLTGPEHVRAAREAGFDRHVSKPIRFDDLLRVIRELGS